MCCVCVCVCFTVVKISEQTDADEKAEKQILLKQGKAGVEVCMNVYNSPWLTEEKRLANIFACL